MDNDRKREKDLIRRDRDIYIGIRDYVERLLSEHEKQHGSDREALQVALSSMNQRLAMMNEFRGSLEDMTRQMVKRDMFDVVVERLAVVENTYVKGSDYQADTRRENEQGGKDFNERDRRLSLLENSIVGRDAFNVLQDKVVELQKSAVTEDALAAQRREYDRSRKSLTYGLIFVGAAAFVNFFLNVLQGSKSIIGG